VTIYRIRIFMYEGWVLEWIFAYKYINGVLSGPADMHFRSYFFKFTVKL